MALNYKYLRILIRQNGISKVEIRSRIMQAKIVFNKKNKKILLTCINIDFPIRERLLEEELYGCKTWTTGKSEEKRLMTFEAWCWRRMFKIGWIERVTNKEGFRRAGEKRRFINKLKRRSAKLIGGTLRHNELLKAKLKKNTQEEG